MHVVVLSNQKGGVGKSTLSVLLAQWLAERHRLRVGVIDLDTQANASRSLARFDSGRAAVTFFEAHGATSTRAQAASIALFPGSKRLADLELARPEFILPAFRNQVAALGECFDVVVIDTPPSLGLRMSAALIAATHVVCPIELEEYSIDGVTDMLKTVFGVRRRYNPGLRLAGLVANRFNPHSVRQKAALRDLVAHYSEIGGPAKIYTRSAIPEALAAGVPVWRLARSSARDAAAEVSVVFDLLMQRIEGTEAPVALSGCA